MAKSFDELVARTTSKRVQERASRRARRYLASMLLSDLRKLKRMSQKELAHTLRIKQPSLSKLENQDDMQISTLTRIVEALGGRLIIRAEFDKLDAELKQFGRKREA
jgi:transcriptional regulator with XRE-family HTH domain